MLLKFRPQVGHLVGGILQPGRLTGRIDRLFARVSRHSKDRIGIEGFFGIDDRSAPLAALLLLFLSPARVLFPLPRFLSLAQACGLFLTPSLATLFLLLSALSKLFRCLCAFLKRALHSGLPQSLGGLMPAFLAKVARLSNLTAANPTLARYASTLYSQKGAAGGGNQRDETDVDPRGRQPRSRFALWYDQRVGLSPL